MDNLPTHDDLFGDDHPCQEHAFTVEAIDGDGPRSGYVWTCTCSWLVTQLPGMPIAERLLGHTDNNR